MANGNLNMSALLSAGSDAFSNMYDITFDGFGNDEALSHAHVRAKGVTIPEVSVETYQVFYHGVTANRMKPQQNFERKLTIEFRLDSKFGLYNAFMKLLGDHINISTGKTANSTVAQGTIKVKALKGDFIASEESKTTLDDKSAKSYGQSGDGTLSGELSEWTFKQCSVVKVTQPVFNTESADNLTFTVDFIFQDCTFSSDSSN